MTHALQVLQVARTEADRVHRFVHLLDRVPATLDRITRATVSGGSWQNDEALAFSQLRPQFGYMLDDFVSRARTHSTVLVAADNAVFLRMLVTGGRKLAPGIIRTDDIPSRHGMSAILTLGSGMTFAVIEAYLKLDETEEIFRGFDD